MNQRGVFIAEVLTLSPQLLSPTPATQIGFPNLSDTWGVLHSSYDAPHTRARPSRGDEQWGIRQSDTIESLGN